MFNEDWKNIYSELKPTIELAFGTVVEKILNGIFETTPYADLFKQ